LQHAFRDVWPTKFLSTRGRLLALIGVNTASLDFLGYYGCESGYGLLS
jgi:hypothetical protein